MTQQAVLYLNAMHAPQPADPPLWAQLAACRLYAQALGFTVAASFVNPHPGSDRAWLHTAEQMTSRVQAGFGSDREVQAVVVYDLAAVQQPDGDLDATAQMHGHFGVHLHSVLPPHVAPIPAAGAGVQAALRDLFATFAPSRRSLGEPRPLPPPNPIPVEPTVWAGLLALLADVDALRQAAAGGRAEPHPVQAAKRRAVRAAAAAEKAVEARWAATLDAYLADAITKEEMSRRADALTAELLACQAVRRRAAADVAAGRLTTDGEARLLAMARCLLPALADLSPIEAGRAAALLDMRTHMHGGAAASCVLPLVDDSMRRAGVWLTGQPAPCTPPLADDWDAEDVLLTWAVEPALLEVPA